MSLSWSLLLSRVVRRPKSAVAFPLSRLSWCSRPTACGALENRRAKKSLAQHWLVDEGILDKIIQTANVCPSDIVLEIGPGTGNLTRRLAKTGALLLAVEKDDALAAELAGSFAPFETVKILHADILSVDLEEALKNEMRGGARERVSIVANLPYNISTPVIRKILPLGDLVSRVLILVQDEFARRMIDAKPGESQYRELTIFAHFFSKMTYEFKVASTCFVPPPKVQSALLSLELKPRSEWPLDTPTDFFRFVRISFSSRRKQIKNNLKPFFDPVKVSLALEKLGISANSRPENLELQQFVELYKLLD